MRFLESGTEGALEAKTMLAGLPAKEGAACGPSLPWTLQWRVREWRARYGPAKEGPFEQVHPRREAAIDSRGEGAREIDRVSRQNRDLARVSRA